MNRQSLYTQLSIAALAALLFIPFLGGAHLFDWDEINFAESAREMLISGNYLTVQIDFRPFLEKPPLFIWMQALSMHIFGINEFAARFPNAVAGIVSLLVLYRLGRKHFNHTFGLLWVMVYAGSILSHFYFRSGIIDPWFNLFMFLGTYYLMEYSVAEVQKWQNMAFSAMFIGLAVLTKGPVGLLVPGLVYAVFLVWKRFKVRLRFLDALIFALVFLLVGGSWFLLQIATGSTQTMLEFIVYQIRLFNTQDAGHGGFPLYHFVVIFFAMFPASILALPAFRLRFSGNEKNTAFHLWMLIMFWVVLILFSIVKTKIVHYSSLAYFPLTFLAALVLYKYSTEKLSLRKFQKIMLWSVAGLLMLVLAVLQWAVANAHFIIESNLIKDKFAMGNLQAVSNWWGIEFLIGLLLLAAVYFLTKHINKGIEYVFRALALSTLFVSLAIYLYPSSIEAYSQRAAIEFYQEKSKETPYLQPMGFKSYAHLFYGQRPLLKQPNQSKEQYNAFIMSDSVDKPVYFVTKNIKLEKSLKEYPNLKVIGEKNGFVFLSK